MREDQAKRLEDLEDRLVETVIADADPNNWSGAGQLLIDMDKATRGDAQWCRKTAVQTVALLTHVQKVIRDYRQPELRRPGAIEDPDPEAAIASAEAAASELIARVTGGRKPVR